MRKNRLCALLLLAGISYVTFAEAQELTVMETPTTIDMLTSDQPQFSNQKSNSAPILLVYAKEKDRKLKIDYTEVFASTMPNGFGESSAPRFIIVGNENKFLFGVGGFVEMRGAYDLGGIVENTDFVTADIPISSSYATHQQGRMSVSSSRIFFKVLGNTDCLGLVEGHIEADFGGEDNTLRLRKAYVSFMGFTVGQTVTTFCDITASPTTIDEQGPNAYTYNRTPMIRYHMNFGSHWSMAVAIEKPSYSIDYGTEATSIPQRMPDIPAYFQYAWGENGSHIRGSGIVRYTQYHNLVDSDNEGKVGWGAQLSGNINAGNKVCFFMQGVYGKGIASYIQDLADENLDLVPSSTTSETGELETVATLGLLGGVQYNISRTIFASLGYSEVKVFNNDDYFVAEQYRGARYAVGNVFWNFVENCQAGLEYLYGTKTTMDKETNHANRIQAMVRYSF